MSCETAVCRTCLATDVKMLNLRRTKLQNIFEKFTDSKLGTPGYNVCYICYSQLQRCQRFVDMALRAQRVFRQLQTKGIQLIPDSVTTLRPTSSFIRTPVACVTLPDADGVVSVKIEPIDVKEESQVSQDGEILVDVKIEDPTEDFLQVCEESYISGDHNYNQTWIQEIKINEKSTSKDGIFFKSSALKDAHEQTCNYCQYTCSDKIEFQRHLRKHTKPFHCNFCNKSFSEQSSLIKHKTSHSSKKPYVCDYCNKGFGHKTYLMQHLRTHTHEKPFKCDVCLRHFAQVGHLITHKLTHSTEPDKRHRCMVCSKLFVARNRLNRHMKTHTGDKPYSCEVCSKSFAARDTLTSHARCHTREKPYSCNVCGKMFTVRGNFYKHMKVHGTEEPVEVV